MYSGEISRIQCKIIEQNTSLYIYLDPNCNVTTSHCLW